MSCKYRVHGCIGNKKNISNIRCVVGLDVLDNVVPKKNFFQLKGSNDVGRWY